MENVVIIIECIALVFVFVGLTLLLKGDGAIEQKVLLLSLCGALVHNFGYLLELLSPTLNSAITAITIENVGSAFVPLCYCWFIYLYCFEKVPKRIMAVLAAVSFFVLPTVIFNVGGLFYSSFEWLALPDGGHYVRVSYGPLYYVFLASRILIPYVLCMAALIRFLKHTKDKKLSQRHLAILIISCIPLVALILYITKVTAHFDMTPATLAFTMSIVVILLWGRKNYSFKHLAAEKVLESLGDGVIVIDEDDRLISSNRAASFIFPDLTPAMQGKNIRSVKGFREEMLNELKPWSFSVNGQHYECHSKQIKDATGKSQGHVMLLLDMTDMKTYINEIKRVRRQAQDANRAKSEFLANMSHEIRTPMNAIIGLNDIIMEECGDSTIYSYSKNVQTAADNLLAIINDILDLSKIESGKLELIKTDYHLRELTDEVMGIMDIQASKKGIVMKYVCDDTLPSTYHGDGGRLKQILINIINNAIKFTTEGYVKVEVSGLPSQDDADEYILSFRVEDTGIGIKEEDIGKIFEDFRQVDAKRNRSVEGTGLGLAIVKHLVELMGGTLDVKSVYGEGTVFTISIPQKVADTVTIAEDISFNVGGHNKPFIAPDFKVLVVDDNAVNRKVAESFLKSYEFIIDQAESGKEAIELVKNNLYDIIFMDHMMPEMDGIEAAHIIRTECGENGAKPNVIALTANAMEGVREQFLANGFQDFISKPLNRKQIEHLLFKWVPEDRRQETAPKEERAESNLDGIMIKGIDIETASRYFDGNKAAYEELLSLYLLEGDRKLESLEELSVFNLPAYQTEVHALKSASANIGATDLSNMARAQENAAAQGEREFISRQLPVLIDKYRELLLEIRRYLNNRKLFEKARAADKKLPDEELLAKVTEAKEHIEDFRSEECVQCVDELLEYSLNEDVYSALTKIKEQLTLYEDDNAEVLLGELEDRLKAESPQTD